MFRVGHRRRRVAGLRHVVKSMMGADPVVKLTLVRACRPPTALPPRRSTADELGGIPFLNFECFVFILQLQSAVCGRLSYVQLDELPLLTSTYLPYYLELRN